MTATSVPTSVRAETRAPDLDPSFVADHLPGTIRPLKPAEVAEALGAGVPLLVGRYRVDLTTGACRWSPEVDVMHGRAAGEPPMGLDELRGRTHPDDQARVARTVVEAVRHGRPFAAAHRVVDGRGRPHTVVVVGEPRRNGTGRPTEIVGHVVDVSPAQREAVDREAGRAATRALASGAVVERATGALMVVGGLSAPDATRRLAEAARTAAVPVAEAAQQVLERLLGRVCPEGDLAHEALVGVCAASRHDNGARLARRVVRRAR